MGFLCDIMFVTSFYLLYSLDSFDTISSNQQEMINWFVFVISSLGLCSGSNVTMQLDAMETSPFIYMHIAKTVSFIIIFCILYYWLQLLCQHLTCIICYTNCLNDATV
jgi:hypothetical protein